MNINNSVKLYQPSERDPYFKVKFKANGKWFTRKRKTQSDAENLFREVSKAIKQGDSKICSLSKTEKERLNAALSMLPEGKNILQVVLEYVEAYNHLNNGAQLSDASRFYSRYHNSNNEITVPELIDQFLQSKQNDWSESHRKVQVNRLIRVKEAFQCNVSDLDSEYITAFMEQFKESQTTTRNHHKATISQLLKFAVALKVIPNIEAFQLVLKKEKVKVKTSEIVSPEQFEQYLRNAPEELVPVLALGGFAGLRPEEISKLTWEDYNRNDDLLSLSAEITKTSLVRYVPKSQALKTWMNQSKKKSGKIQTIPKTTKNKLVSKLKQRFGGPNGKSSQGRDLFRHCYVSYRYGECRKAATVAEETGHSLDVLRTSYLILVDPKDSVKWFSIKPEEA